MTLGIPRNGKCPVPVLGEIRQVVRDASGLPWQEKNPGVVKLCLEESGLQMHASCLSQSRQELRSQPQAGVLRGGTLVDGGDIRRLL